MVETATRTTLATDDFDDDGEPVDPFLDHGRRKHEEDQQRREVLREARIGHRGLGTSPGGKDVGVGNASRYASCAFLWIVVFIAQSMFLAAIFAMVGYRAPTSIGLLLALPMAVVAGLVVAKRDRHRRRLA